MRGYWKVSGDTLMGVRPGARVYIQDSSHLLL